MEVEAKTKVDVSIKSLARNLVDDSDSFCDFWLEVHLYAKESRLIELAKPMSERMGAGRSLAIRKLSDLITFYQMEDRN